MRFLVELIRERKKFSTCFQSTADEEEIIDRLKESKHFPDGSPLADGDTILISEVKPAKEYSYHTAIAILEKPGTYHGD